MRILLLAILLSNTALFHCQTTTTPGTNTVKDTSEPSSFNDGDGTDKGNETTIPGPASNGSGNGSAADIDTPVAPSDRPADETITGNTPPAYDNDKSDEDYDHHTMFFGMDSFFSSFLSSKLWPYMAIAIFFVTAAISNVLFHFSPFYELVPESCLLLMFGMVFGGIIYATGLPIDEYFVLTHDRFFYVMLPPIILESAFQLHARDFFTNLVPIAIFAILGTVMNAFLVAALLMGFGHGLSAFSLANDMSFQELLIFSTIIAAVDPVAVLSIFQELKINNPLYFIVFGESLFNDAVVIVMYNVVQEPGVSFLKGFLTFMYVFFVAMAVGAVTGLVTILISRFTHKFRDAEPVVAIAMGYLSYLIAEYFGLSGIVSMTIYGLIYSEYINYNFKKKSNITIAKTVKTLAGISETMIFFLLGVVFFVIDYQWDTGFVFWSLLFCLMCRSIVVFTLTFIVNWMHPNRPISFFNQILVSFGGLRGAIAFSLVHMLTSAERSVMFETTVMFIILFTVFAFGIPTKPLANMLRVKRQGKKSKSASATINNGIIEWTVPVIQRYSGFGSHCPRLEQYLEKVNNKLIVPTLITGGIEEVRKRQNPFGLRDQVGAPAIENQVFKELFKEFDPSDFKAEAVDKLVSGMSDKLPDLDIIGLRRVRQHPSDNIAKAMSQQ